MNDTLIQIRLAVSNRLIFIFSNKLTTTKREKKQKRERTLESIEYQYTTTVKPMYEKYVEPTKKYSDLIIKEISKSDKGYIKLLEIISTLIK